MHRMTIGTAAREAGVGVETIRFYEREGLVPQPTKPAGNGYRIYPEETGLPDTFIRQAQSLGFSLGEIRELLDLRGDPGADAAAIRDRAAAKLADVDDKIRRLERIRSALQALLATCPGRGALAGCSIMGALEGDPTAETKNSEANREP